MSSESKGIMLSELLEAFDPELLTPKLGKHTTDFAALLASANANAKKPAALPDIQELRASVASSLKGQELVYPKNVNASSYRTKMIGGMNCYQRQASDFQSVPTLVMFYGGGFCLNTMFAHQAFMANVAARTPCNVILPDLPLAPENKAPAVIAKSSEFLQELLKNPIGFGASENVILLGWSSGSNLALTLALKLKKEAPEIFNKISQLILLSSWMDLSMRVAREGPYQVQQQADTIAAGADLLEIMSQCYLPEGFQGDEPEFCPASRSADEMRKLPQVSVIAGGCEVLLGDSVFVADRLRRANVPVQFIALEGQTHNYLVFQKLSQDGVYVPELVARIVGGQSIAGMVGSDGLGLVVRKFNMK